MSRIVALIPARGGSKRIPHKNIRPLGPHPLIAYTIAAARESGVFDGGVWVSTDSEEIGGVALSYLSHQATGPTGGVIYRPAEYATDESPDIEWVTDALLRLRLMERVNPDAFSILRPTSPFRTATTIRRAFERFSEGGRMYDSLRAVEPPTHHPGKAWVLRGDLLLPLLPFLHADGTPWHSSPTQTLPVCYGQNACIEMAWTDTVRRFGSISGHRVLPFFTTWPEGIDLNTPEEWDYASWLVETGRATLPTVEVAG